MEDLKATNRSPLNNSKSKAMYSFPRDNRFKLEKEIHDAFYNTTIGLSKRATSMGFGKKLDIAQGTEKSPSPDKYQMKSFFINDPKKGITFGAGRDNIKFVSIFSNNSNPGPATYNPDPKIPSKNYSMRKKIDFPELYPQNFNPAPGSYDLEGINKSGLYHSSKMKSNISYKIHKSPQKQNKHHLVNIGPGTYNTALSSNGKQILAQKKTEQTTSFSKSIRQTLSLSLLSPGPGKYQFFSQFGK